MVIPIYKLHIFMTDVEQKRKVGLIIKRYSNFHSSRHSIYIIGANSYRNCESFYIAVKDRNLVFRCWALSVCTVKSRKSHRRKKTYSNFIQAKIMCCVLFFWAIRYSLCISFCISKRNWIMPYRSKCNSERKKAVVIIIEPFKWYNLVTPPNLFISRKTILSTEDLSSCKWYG